MKNMKKVIIPAIAAIALCISLIAGATYAWFTDTAKTNVNTIKSGKLDVSLEMSVDGQNWEDAENKTLSFLKMKEDGTLAADENVLWEPGCTYKLPYLRVVNNGNLALKYKVVLTGLDGDSMLLDVISFTGAEGIEGKLLAEEKSDAISISAHMDENAGNEYMAKELTGVSVTVYATQASEEYDSINNEYDKDAQFSEVVAAGKTFTSNATLTTGIIATDVNAIAVKAIGENANVVIEGGYFNGGKGGDNICVSAANGATVTIKGGSFFVGGDANGYGNSTVYSQGGTVNIYGGFFKSECQYNGKYYVLNQSNGNPGTITVYGGTFVNYNPANGDDNLGGNFVAEGCAVMSYAVGEDTYYTVYNVNKAAEGVQEAFDKGGEIALPANLDPTEALVVAKEVTLDATGKTIENTADVWDAAPYSWSLISAQKGGKLTILGGTFKAKENDCYAVDVQDGSTVVIKDGNFNGNIHAVYVQKGTAIIEGGFYEVQQQYPDASKAYEFVLNCYDANRKNGTAKIIVTGGTFVNFNPADCYAEGAHTNFLAEGYKVETSTRESDGATLYTVVKA